jgi:hypothetical protein
VRCSNDSNDGGGGGGRLLVASSRSRCPFLLAAALPTPVELELYRHRRLLQCRRRSGP